MLLFTINIIDDIVIVREGVKQGWKQIDGAIDPLPVIWVGLPEQGRVNVFVGVHDFPQPPNKIFEASILFNPNKRTHLVVKERGDRSWDALILVSTFQRAFWKVVDPVEQACICQTGSVFRVCSDCPCCGVPLEIHDFGAIHPADKGLTHYLPFPMKRRGDAIGGVQMLAQNYLQKFRRQRQYAKLIAVQMGAMFCIGPHFFKWTGSEIQYCRSLEEVLK